MLDVLLGWPGMVLLFAVGLGVAVFLARGGGGGGGGGSSNGGGLGGGGLGGD